MKNNQKNNGQNKIVFLLFAIVFFCACFFSCSSKTTALSITSTLDEVDRYILQGQTESAVKLLSKTDKKSLPVSARLGIYKRFVKLGEQEKADKLLKSCLKKNPDDKMLLAIYSSRLLKQGKIGEALSVSKKLSGTEYGSFYAEALLRSRTQSSGTMVAFIDFCLQDYAPVFFDAYSGSKDNAWLRNCAVISLVNGHPDQALQYHPSLFSDATDAYFWACVSYDNKKYVETSEDLKLAKEFVEHEIYELKEFNQASRQKENLNLKIRSLLADSYISLSENSLAEQERNSLLNYLSTLDEEEVIEDSVPEKYRIPSTDILSVIYLNSALWSLAKEDYKAAYNLLKFEVEKWPDYGPGLIGYGNFAYNSSLLKLDDPLTLELRRLGVRSMDMQAYDEIPKVPVEDALSRMEDSLSRFKNFELYVAKLDLEDKIKNYSEKTHLAKIYQTIERNTLGTNQYPPEIAQYAVHGLLLHEHFDEAETLFKKYVARRYKFETDSAFYDEFFRHIHQIDTWEIEYAAWFATHAKKASLATQLYEFIVFNEYLYEQKHVQELSPKASACAMLNLAMIYSSTKRKDEAIKLYGKASGSIQNHLLKAEAMYRIGVLYADAKDTENALKSLKYAVYLNPEHSKARLLLGQLK